MSVKDNESMKMVSFITPFYNGNRYLPHLCEVLTQNTYGLAQRWPDMQTEWIIVNDSPQTPVEAPASSAFSIHVVNHPHNAGIHAARATGLQHASGSLVLFLDQDDEIAPDFLVRQVQTIRDTGADVVVSNAWIEQSDGRKLLLYRTRFQYRKILRMAVYTKTHNQIVSPGQCLIRRASIPEFWQSHILRQNGSDDLFLWMLMLADHKHFAIVPEPLYTHKYTGSNLSAAVSKMNGSSLEVCDLLRAAGTVPAKYIRDLHDSRALSQAWMQAGAGRKIMLAAANLRLLVPAAWWKLRSMVSGRADT